jgi:hypothetical protein
MGLTLVPDPAHLQTNRLAQLARLTSIHKAKPLLIRIATVTPQNPDGFAAG